jgi:clan AA aspartic protease (TIGR02281 family)
MRRIIVALFLLVVTPGVSAALTPAELNEAGKAAYGRGDFQTAERLFGEAVAGGPAEPLYHYHRGVALVRLGRLAEGRASYERARSLKPPPGLAATIAAALREFETRSETRPAPETEPAAVALEGAKGLWFVEVTLNGARRARFLVDTGATWCTISRDLADELGIVAAADTPVVEVMTANGKASGPRVALDSIKVGETEAADVETLVLPLDGSFEGILGNSFLSRYLVMLDGGRRLLHLRPRQ